MIEWLARADPDSVFLITAEETWSYARTLEEVRRRLRERPVRVTPARDAAGVFDVLAGIAGGGVMLVPPHVAAPRSDELEGAALVVFTSGTTGGPKPARLTMDNLSAAAAASMEHLGHGSDDVWLSALPLHHVGGVSVLVRSAYAGGAVLLRDRFEPAVFAASLRGPATMASVVATMLIRLLAEDGGPYPGLRAVLVGGGPIPDGLLEEAVEAGLPVLPSYGMTETFGQVATLRPGSPVQRRAHPLPGVELRIEETGRVAVRGPQVSPGYLGEPDRDSEWLVSGDLGVIDEEGALRVLGRADHVIVTGGENVAPEQVEAELESHPEVVEAMVLGLPDETWGMQVACLYAGEAEEDELRGWLATRVPVFMVPKLWLRVDAVPRTVLGKPDRSAGERLLGAG